jgi:hypothetical protein
MLQHYREVIEDLASDIYILADYLLGEGVQKAPACYRQESPQEFPGLFYWFTIDLRRTREGAIESTWESSEQWGEQAPVVRCYVDPFPPQARQKAEELLQGVSENSLLQEGEPVVIQRLNALLAYLIAALEEQPGEEASELALILSRRDKMRSEQVVRIFSHT